MFKDLECIKIDSVNPLYIIINRIKVILKKSMEIDI